MKITRVLPAAVLAAGVLLSASACAPAEEKKADVSASPSVEQSVTPSETPSAEASPKVDEAVAVATTINDFYTYVSDPANASKIEEAGAPLEGRGAVATAEELEALADSLPEGFKYFDTSTPDLIKNAYVQLLMGSSLMSAGTMTATVPVGAVTVTDDTATVDATKFEITLNGEKTPIPSTAGEQLLKLRKDAAGQWVMIADEFAQASSEASK